MKIGYAQKGGMIYEFTVVVRMRSDHVMNTNRASCFVP